MTINPDVEVIFLPPNTTSLIQPMDQSIITTFKAYYLRRILQSMLQNLNKSDNTVKQFWKQFNIAHSLSMVDECWKEIQP